MVDDRPGASGPSKAASASPKAPVEYALEGQPGQQRLDRLGPPGIGRRDRGREPGAGVPRSRRYRSGPCVPADDRGAPHAGGRPHPPGRRAWHEGRYFRRDRLGQQTPRADPHPSVSGSAIEILSGCENETTLSSCMVYPSFLEIVDFIIARIRRHHISPSPRFSHGSGDFPSGTFTNPFKQIGRNDPCPRGFGKITGSAVSLDPYLA